MPNRSSASELDNRATLTQTRLSLGLRKKINLLCCCFQAVIGADLSPTVIAAYLRLKPNDCLPFPADPANGFDDPKSPRFTTLRLAPREMVANHRLPRRCITIINSIAASRWKLYKKNRRGDKREVSARW